MFGNRVKDAYSLSLRVKTTINNISIFYHNINVKEFFFKRELKKTLRDTLTRAAWYGLLSTMAN